MKKAYLQKKLLQIIPIFILFYSLKLDYFLGDLSHLTLNSSFNLANGNGYNYGNLNNLTPAVKNSPLISILLSFVFMILNPFFEINYEDLILISSVVVILISSLAVIFFYETIEVYSSRFAALLTTGLFISNIDFLNILLKISSESLGLLLIILWTKQILLYFKNYEIIYLRNSAIISSLFFAARYQLLIIHLLAIALILIVFIKKRTFNYFIFIPISTLLVNFLYNWYKVESIFGHPSGVKGDSFEVLILNLFNIFKSFLLIDGFIFNKYLVIFIAFTTAYYLIKDKVFVPENFKKINKTTTNIYIVIFTIFNIAFLLITLNLNKADQLSLRYLIYYLFFVFIIFSIFIDHNKFFAIYLIILVFFNTSQLIDFNNENKNTDCYCSDLSVETVSYISKYLKNENFLGSRFMSQIYYSNYAGNSYPMPFYSNYNEAYERDLYLEEDELLSFIQNKKIKYIVFFEGKDKKDYFIEAKLYGDLIEDIYYGKSKYFKSEKDLNDGKIVELNY